MIYGLLYLSMKPLSLDDIVDLLGISKASASMGTRQLSAWGALRAVWVPGERRDHFEVVGDLEVILREGFTKFLRPRIETSEKKMATLWDALNRDRACGALTSEEHQFCVDRIDQVSRLQKRLKRVTPLIQKLVH
jgi:DNA-binding transcriptional regulator GbsR (MarR family)